MSQPGSSGRLLRVTTRAGEVGHLEIRQRASEYLDGELTHEERLAFERHLHRCEPCRRFVGELRAVVKVLGAVGEEPEARPPSREEGRPALSFLRLPTAQRS